MLQIDAVEFQENLPGYLKRVEHGEVIKIASHGRVFARLAPEQNDVDAARKRLALIQGTVIIGDILNPLEDSGWNSDADHL
ncbi:MAG: hypothetical protein H7833_02335 [Magnetococcus sp. DMHC-1]|nr:type II toxin-antitoxin system prevent-host-death family antitoxin [Magnetococcales bacterium]